jgi:hypothetical protein
MLDVECKNTKHEMRHHLLGLPALATARPRIHPSVVQRLAPPKSTPCRAQLALGYRSAWARLSGGCDLNRIGNCALDVLSGMGMNDRLVLAVRLGLSNGGGVASESYVSYG